VDSTQNIGEYDDNTQAAIRKIMFDQKQKVSGCVIYACSMTVGKQAEALSMIVSLL